MKSCSIYFVLIISRESKHLDKNMERRIFVKLLGIASLSSIIFSRIQPQKSETEKEMEKHNHNKQMDDKVKKVLFINGSPRRGNTKYALETMVQTMKENYSNVNYEFIDVAKLNMQGCTNCDACKKNGGFCIHPDDTNHYMDKMMAADVLIFGTPVYWWGMSGQLKIFIDKFYSKDGLIQEGKSKQVGVLSFGANELSDIQYKLITDQFQSICNFLKWELIFSEGFSCYKKDDLRNDKEVTEEVVGVVGKM